MDHLRRADWLGLSEAGQIKKDRQAVNRPAG
jgi:hypothetical protein